MKNEQKRAITEKLISMDKEMLSSNISDVADNFILQTMNTILQIMCFLEVDSISNKRIGEKGWNFKIYGAKGNEYIFLNNAKYEVPNENVADFQFLLDSLL